jgi:NAD(P)-dependent dehydrogenase (short-subunit alcohol dehydrogenase family)
MRQVVISGMTRGLGAAMFRALLEAGTRPVGIGRNFPDDVVAAARAERCRLVACDLAQTRDLLALDFETAIAAETTGIVFVNCAGIVVPIGRIGQLDEPALIASLMVNAAAPAVVANKLAALAARRGIACRMVNIGSGAATTAIAGWSAYCAGKAATRMFFRAVAAEESGVTVSDLDPGVLDTGMQADIRAASREAFPQRDRFVAYHRDGVLRDPTAVAREILTEQELL